jgi:PAS domain S-box-containing protein
LLHHHWQILFPPFRLDTAEERVWHGSRPVVLRPKSVALLRYLLDHPGQLLTKNVLLDAIWANTYVSDAVLPSCIREIKQALDDLASTPKFIETVHRRGYRFIAQPRRISGAEASLNDHMRVRPPVISPESIDTSGGVLARIYDAICQAIGPIQDLLPLIPTLERIAQAVEDRRDSTEQIGLLYENREVLFQPDPHHLLRPAPSPVAVVGRDYRFVSVSDSYCQLFGFSRQQLRTLLLKDLLDRRDLERFALANGRLFADQANSVVFVGRRLASKGASILTKATAWSVRPDPCAEPEYAVGMLQRLADRHEAQELFARCAEKLAKNRHRLVAPRAPSMPKTRSTRSAAQREPQRQ